jgi:hypothetical protein
MVVDENGVVLANCTSEAVAKAVATDHNKGDPIKTYWDWLDAKSS